ncbi:TPA: phage minor head protein [Streptococcus suis]
MTELNKFQREIESLLQKADKATDRRLYDLYIDTIKDLKKSLLVDYQRLDALTSSQKLKLSQMSTLLEQLDQSADKLKKGLRSEITGHLIDTGKIAYNELFYEFEGGHGGINFAMLKEDELRTVIETPVANFKLSERLDDGVVERLKNNIKDDLNRIFLHGASYAEASARLAEQGYSSYRRAMVITRTEAGRVQAVARQKAQDVATELGIKLSKMWVATLDGRTRHNHAELDGQVVAVEERFEINGLEAKQPHMFGFASEDVNCRCRTVSVLDDVQQKFKRRDNETGEVIEYQSYREWAKAKGFDMPRNSRKNIELVEKNPANGKIKVKEVPLFSKFTTASDMSRDELAKGLANEFGMQISETSRTKLPQLAMEQTYSILKSFEELYNKLPQRIPQVRALAASKSKGAIAWYSRTAATSKPVEFGINVSYFADRVKLQDVVDYNIKKGWFSKNGDINHIMVHEFGHHVDFQLTKLTDRQFSDIIFDEMMRQYPEKYDVSSIGQVTSGYAGSFYKKTQKNTETFAELFAEAYGETPREVANDFRNIFEEKARGVLQDVDSS